MAHAQDEQPAADAAPEIDAFTPAQEAESVIASEQANWPQNEGDTVALVHSQWFNSWTEYANFKRDENGQPDVVKSPFKIVHHSPRPGPIPNKCLLQDDSDELREGLHEGDDFVIVCKATWELLQQWYGGGPAILRECWSESSGREKKVVASIYYFHLKAHRSSDDEVKDVTVSKQTSVSDLKLKCCKAFGLEEGDVRIWDYWHQNKHGLLEDRLDTSAAAAKLFENQDILLEEKVDGKFPDDEAKPMLLEAAASPVSTPIYSPCFSPLSSGYGLTSYGTRSFNEDSVNAGMNLARGAAGLNNLGNTCFMNSSVQCLAHTVPIMRQFLGGTYAQELNRDNPLGRGGKLAESFGGLMEKLWQGNVSSVTPRGFKAAIANFAPQFAGYAQQDSQELLAFLLDGLHEDMNRVKKKRYIEDRDYNGQPDEEWAAEAWSNYRENNDSVIVDHFQGMYKSTLVCPDCHQPRVSFEPMMYLTLPLPAEKMRTAEVNIVHADGSAPPALYAVEVPKEGTIGDLYTALAKALDIPQEAAEELLLLVEVDDQRVKKRFTDMEAAVKEALGSGARWALAPVLLAYRYPHREAGPKSASGQQLLVYFRQKSNSYYYGNPKPMAPPLLLWVPAENLTASLDGIEEVAAPTSGLSFMSSDVEFCVAQSSPIAANIATALRPIKRQRIGDCRGDNSPMAAANAGQQQETAAATLAPQTPGVNGNGADVACVSGNGADVAMADTAADEADGSEPAENDWADASPAAVMPKLPKLEADSSPAQRAAGNGTASRPSTPVQDGQPPYSMPNGVASEQGAAAEASAVAAAVQDPLQAPAAGPFDMWAAQSNSQPEAAAAGLPQPDGNSVADAAVAEASSNAVEPVTDRGEAAYVLKFASRTGDTRFSKGTRPDDKPPWFVAVDFTDDAGSAFDLQALQKPSEHPSVKETRARQARGPPPIPLEDCVKAQLQPEQLDEANSWYCPRCKKHTQARKKLDLWTLPEVLVVHLKRFAASRLARDKLDHLVQFPLSGLDLSPHVLRKQDVPPVYDLFAVSNHYGGLGGGHYTAHARLPPAGKWYSFDDSRANGPLSESDVVSSAAYLLFYRRRHEASQDNGQAVLDKLEAAAAAERAQANEAAQASEAALAAVATGGSDGRVHGGSNISLADMLTGPSAVADNPLAGLGGGVGGTNTGSSSSLEKMGGRSEEEDDALLYDMEGVGTGCGFTLAAGDATQPDSWQEPAACPGDEAVLHPKARRKLRLPADKEEDSHFSKGSWPDFQVGEDDNAQDGEELSKWN